PTVETMRARGMPAAEVFLALAILVEFVGGLSVLLGWKARLGALLLALYLIPVTLLFPSFWNFEGMAQMNQMLPFLKNVTIMGGLITLVGAGAGRFSLDACRKACAMCTTDESTTGERTTIVPVSAHPAVPESARPATDILDEAGVESFPASDP